MAENPIFVEYHSYLDADCYKILLPWPDCKEDKQVLCLESDGIIEARIIASQVMEKHMIEAFSRPVK